MTTSFTSFVYSARNGPVSRSRAALRSFSTVYPDPTAFAIMSDCRNTAIGVWSENSVDRSVVVAVYGQPA